MENELRKKVHFVMAQKRVEQLRNFYGHFIIYCTVNILFLIFWYFDSYMPKTFWEPAFYAMVGGAGFVVLAHGLLVFGSKYILPKGWEERKLKELMKAEKKHQTTKYE